MKFIDEFRDGRVAERVARAIQAEASSGRSYHIMEFCGGHTHAIARYGLPDLLPDAIRLVHGPGCPVCVLPVGRIDTAIALARDFGVILCTYADLMRVPGSNRQSLLAAKAQGADVVMVYSARDALAVAKAHPHREVVFFAIGFETTTPPTAAAILEAQREGLTNFSVACNHVLTPSAIQSLLDSPEVRAVGSVRIDGFIGPSHVSTIIGSRPYEFFAEEYEKPVVIAGFEPLDVLQAIWMLVRQINEGRCTVENQFARAVTREGNRKAQGLVQEVFELARIFEWRGLGDVPYSALRIQGRYGRFDAERRFGYACKRVPDHKGCECGAILRGVKQPQDCRLFGSACVPDNPMGSCMVSSEGACAAHYTYGRYRRGVAIAQRQAAGAS
ncbi:hydrogenase formation protein HypD [Acidiferrobacter sp.]|uniref:hydrogenase formation protein HypD n=1 Tax=Acidiferrobacter sp. TaxID=1872107 RepID=UPI002638F8C2|nr:hydrogenase formation protein HypD [Acidiferrobacter sp.]